MATISKKDFVNCIQKSGVIDPEQFKKWLEVFEGGPESDSTTKLATNLVRDELLTKWQAKYLLSGRSRLDIGSYRLLERTSRDELGDRFLALHTSLARKVDIQVLPTDLTQDKARSKEFMQKASLAAKLDHANLVHVYDIDREGGRYFLVTEHVEGTTLEQTARTKLSHDDVARITSSALKGMTYAHANNVVHGKITTNDLVLTETGEVKIQNLTLSPLRQFDADTQSSATISPAADFSAIAKIGRSLLKEISVSQNSEVDKTLAGLIGAIDPTGKETIQSSIDAIDLWRTNNGSVVDPEPDDPFGDVESPIPMSVIGSTKKKRAKEEADKAATKEEAADDSTPGVIGRTWNENPVAVIATAAVLGLMLIGGSIFGAMSLFGNGDEVVAKTNSGKDAQSNITKTTSAQKPPVKSKPESDPTVPTKNDMDNFMANIGNANTEQAPDTPAADNPGNEQANTKPGTVIGDPSFPKNGNAQNTGTTESPLGQPADNPPEMANKTTPANTEGDTAKGTPPANAEADVQDYLARKINGIGKKTQNKLAEVNIKTFKKLASMSPDEIKAALKSIDYFLPRQNYDEWIMQAKAIIGDTTPMSTAAAPTSPEASDKVQNFDTNSPFAKFPRIVGLPEMTSTEEVKLGDLVIKRQHLLGGELLCEPGFAKGKLTFEMNRTPDDKQKWFIGYKRREKDEATNIAMIRKSEDAVYFNWLPEAAESKYAGSLKNCFLKLKLPDDVNCIVTLRKPVKFSDLRLTEKNLQNRVLVSLPDLPTPETIIVEMAPMRVSGLQLRTVKSLIEPNSPAKFQFKRDDKNGFFWVQVAGDFRRDLKLQANLIMLVDGRANSVPNLKSLNEISIGLKQRAAQAFSLYQQKKDLVAPKGKKGEYDDAKKELLSLANKAQAAADKMDEYAGILNQTLNQPINVSVYSKLGKYPRVLLAVSDPELFGKEMDDKKKKRKK